MSAPSEFAQLMADVRSGSDEAVEQLIEKYGRAVLFAVKRGLRANLRVLYDSEDLVQSVWASFFRLPVRQAEFNTPAELIGYLTKMARHRVVAKARLQSSQKRAAPGRCSLDSSIYQNQAQSAQPGPEEIAIARETEKRFEAHLPSRYRSIVELRLEGRTQADIAKELGIHERTVRTILQRLSDYSRTLA